MSGLLEAFILFVVITDPIITVAAFLTMTRGRKPAERKRIAIKAVAVAAAIFFIFALGGEIAFKALGVDFNAFRAAGGVILVLLGVQMTLGLTFPKEHNDISEIAVVIGTPMISGPGLITTTMIFVKSIGLASTLVAGSAAMVIIFASLLLAQPISRIVGRSGIRVLSTMMGIITIAWGLQFILSGVAGFLAAVV